MPVIDLPTFVHQADRIRRLTLSCREGAGLHELNDGIGGWLSVHDASAEGAFPSANSNRIYWLTSERVVTGTEVKAALELARSLHRRRMFLWFGPSAWSEALHVELERQGATLWEYATYPGLARETGEYADPRATTLAVRTVEKERVRDVMEAVRPWYSDNGVRSAVQMVERGIAELHAAFDGPGEGKPVAVGTLAMDGACGYLGSAGTDPVHRGRGGQTSLIHSRVRRAAELGATWCLCETNTVAAVSLRNLKRCGFEEVVWWRVYGWEDRAAAS